MDRLILNGVRINEINWRHEQDFLSGEYRVINTDFGNGVTRIGIVIDKRNGVE